MNSDDDPSPPPNRPSTWIILAAVLATVALIGGLITIFSQEGDRLLNGTPAARADDQPARPAAAPTVPPAPETLPAIEGTVTASCTLDEGTPNAQTRRIEYEQRCALDEATPQPFEVPQTIALSVVTGEPANGTARSFVSADGRGYVTAGYVLGSEQWFVGGAPGAGDFAGLPIHFTGHSGADGGVVYDWYVDDGPPPVSATEGAADVAASAEVTFVCVPTPPASADTASGNSTAPDDAPVLRQSCTYDGDDPRFVPTSSADQAVLTASGGGAGRFGTTRFFAATYESGSIRTGLVESTGVLRFAGVATGSGELDGLLVHEIGWGETSADGTATGVIEMIATPADG